MRKILIILSIMFSVAVGVARSYDKEIAEAINNADWFALDSIYAVAPEGSISDFLDVFSRALIGNRFNRPDISIPAFEKLLTKHTTELGPDQMISCAIMCAVDKSRQGDNVGATAILGSVQGKLLEEGNIKAAQILERFIQQYSSLAEYHPYRINIEGSEGEMSFKMVAVGRPEKKGVHMRLEDGFINGIPADITFDTGAGVNVIASSLVEKYNLIPIDVETKVSGAKPHNGSLAIAKEMKIGNISVGDVPFYVMDITANNDEADQYMQSLNIIIGSDLMLQLKDMTIDFENSRIIVPVEAPSKTDSRPNLCFSSQMNLLVKGLIRDCGMLMNVDTGDSGYGCLGKEFYKKNKKFIKTEGKETNIRLAGIGGVEISKGYEVADLLLNLGGNSVDVPVMEVMPKSDCFGGYECNLGVKTLMLFRSVRFNLVDFVLSTESYKSHAN
ncbi:MAG: retropepsin-like domain-containing protein [Muribaculaceae bacterium]|nr:retropepsin-like domain-containing protein [Muribaculaceae bacterium]